MKQKQRGFTIVELLIVIVVISILAAITAVVYTGSIVDSKNNGAKANAAIIQKKFEAYLAGTGSYPMPTDTTLSAVLADLNSRNDSSLANTGLYIVGNNGWDLTNTDQTRSPLNATLVSYCSSPANPQSAGAYRLQYYDFKANAAASTVIIGSLGTVPCDANGWIPLQ